MSEIIEELLKAARQAREHAYAPYSKYKVGAAALDVSGRIWTGANVENASYPAGICAERVAIAKMASAGAHVLEMVAVVTEDGGPPCGMCLQVMLEFSPDPSRVLVVLGNATVQIAEYKLSELLPHGFGPKSGAAS